MTEQQYALYEWHHQDTGKAYVGIYKYSPERNYISSSTNDEFWKAHKAGQLTRKITWIADEATIRCMENDILATVKDYGSTDAFYNLCFKPGPSGVVFTDEVREKLSDSSKKQWEDPEVRESMSGSNHHMFNKTHSVDTKQRQSIANSGKKNPMFGIKPANVKTYNILALDGSLFTQTDDPTCFEKEHGLATQALSHSANPNNTRRYITINGEKYTVEYAD